MTVQTQEKTPTTLWIGGSLCLARTYINKFYPNDLLLTGLEASLPSWAQGSSYEQLDLTTLNEQDATLFSQTYPNINKIIIGVRPLLFTAYTKNSVPEKMLEGIQVLLRVGLQVWKIQLVLHISSVAAIDHLRSQHYVSEEDPIPPLAEIKAPYDIFKRSCEETIGSICQQSNTAVCHLRLSAIFSDDHKCIQCSALKLQSRIGPYLSLAIDCNSAANVASAIIAILQKGRLDSSVYYYTHPLSLKQPVPYGYYLKTYRQAYSMEKTSIWIPAWIVTSFVALVHWVASWNHVYVSIPYLDAADYLLQVASREHSFNCDNFANDFPGMKEESILECFLRRNDYLEKCHLNSNGNRTIDNIAPQQPATKKSM